MLIVPRPHPKEFRDDVVAVARRGDAPVAEVAKDFGISESCLRNWLLRAEVEDGHRPDAGVVESAEPQLGLSTA
jgi:transposase